MDIHTSKTKTETVLKKMIKDNETVEVTLHAHGIHIVIQSIRQNKHHRSEIDIPTELWSVLTPDMLSDILSTWITNFRARGKS